MKVRLRRVVLIVTVTLGLSYLALCAVVFVLQKPLVYPAPPGEPGLLPSELVQVPGGTPMLWAPPPSPTASVVVHFHGNGEQLIRLRFLAELCQAQGLGFAAPEYPGYGVAGPQPGPSEARILAAAQAALSHLTAQLGVSKERLILSGQSLGTGVAVQLAAKGWGRKVVLLSPYSSLPDVAARVLSMIPVRLLMTERFDSYEAAPEVRAPVLVIHGTRDEVIPFELGQKLSARFATVKRVDVDGAHHNDLWSHTQVVTAYTAFITTP